MEDLFRQHWSLVVGYLTRRTGDRHRAEELAQETFYRATRAFLGWRGGSPSGWLLAIARNVLIDDERKGRATVPLDPEGLPAVEMASGLEIHDAMARLPAAQRRLLELVYFDGLSHAEIAAMANASVGAVKTAVYRARLALRTQYEDNVDEEH